MMTFGVELSAQEKIYFQKIHIARAGQLRNFIQRAQGDYATRLALRDSIEHIINLLYASKEHQQNRAEYVSLVLFLGQLAIQWGYNSVWDEFVKDIYGDLTAHQDPLQMSHYYCLLSRLQEAEHNWDVALENARRAYVITLQINDLSVQQDKLVHYSQIARLKGVDLGTIDLLLLQFWQKLELRYGADNIPPEFIKAYAERIQVNYLRNQTHKMLELLNAMSIDPDADVDADIKAQWFHNMGVMTTWHSNEFARADDALEKAWQLYHEIDDEVGMVEVLSARSILSIRVGDFHTAFEHIQRAQQLNKRDQHLRQQAMIHGLRGLCYYYMGDIDSAEEDITQQSILTNRLELKRDFYRAIGHLGHVYFARQDYYLANHLFEMSYDYYGKNRDVAYVNVVVLRGFVQLFLGDDAAVINYMEDINAWIRHHAVAAERIHYNIARIQGLLAHRQGDFTQARHHFQDALVHAKDNPLMRASVLLDMCRIQSGEEQNDTWQQAQQQLMQAGSEGWCNVGTPDEPPCILVL
jgi:tetratricopeptide (TPR) repeat protein